MNPVEQEIIDEFEALPDWLDRYNYIIELADDLPMIDESKRTPSHLIEGCQSRVWIDAELDQGKMRFTADSDAIITKGIIALLIRVLDGRTPAEVLNEKLEFLDRIGLSENLSPTRANGLLSMIRQMKLYATAYESARNIRG